MKISKLIEELEKQKSEHGDIEVMINNSFESEDIKNVFRTTVETLIFDTGYNVLNKRKKINHILLVL